MKKITVKRTIFLICMSLIVAVLAFGAYQAYYYFYARLYNVIGLSVGVNTHRDSLVAALGEPSKREQVYMGTTRPVTGEGRPVFVYYYHYDGLLFRLGDWNNRVVILYIDSDNYVLQGRDRLRVGSTRADVERALSRPTSSNLTQNFWIYRAESSINVTIDKMYDVRFMFDEYDIVQQIQIGLWG